MMTRRSALLLVAAAWACSRPTEVEGTPRPAVTEANVAFSDCWRFARRGTRSIWSTRPATLSTTSCQNGRAWCSWCLPLHVTIRLAARALRRATSSESPTPISPASAPPRPKSSCCTGDSCPPQLNPGSGLTRYAWPSCAYAEGAASSVRRGFSSTRTWACGPNAARAAWRSASGIAARHRSPGRSTARAPLSASPE